MQDLKIYIVIQDPKTKQDVNITGNFEVLRAFLSGVGTLEIQSAPMQSFPAPVDPSPLASAVPVQSATKRKTKKPIPQPD